MAGKRQTKQQLRWRPNKIALWREFRDLTQQEVSDHLAELKPPIILTRNSISRVEAGKQMASIGAMEAMARLFGTDLDSMINLTPSQAQAVMEFRALPESEQRTALRTYKASRNTD